MTSHDITVTFRVNLSTSPPEARTRRHAVDLVHFYLAPIVGDPRIIRVVPGERRGPRQLTVSTYLLEVGDRLTHPTSGRELRVRNVILHRHQPETCEIRFRDIHGAEYSQVVLANVQWEVTRG